MTTCQCCFTDFLAKCEDEIIIRTNLTPGDSYRWVIEDKFGSLYEGTAIAEDDGSLIIPVEDLPPGLLTQYSGDFNLQIYSEDSCSPIKFKIAGEYDCIGFNIHGGTFEKNTIGCEATFALQSGGNEFEISATFAAISDSTTQRLVIVTADETNNGDMSLYLYDGTQLLFLQTIS